MQTIPFLMSGFNRVMSGFFKSILDNHLNLIFKNNTDKPDIFRYRYKNKKILVDKNTTQKKR